MQPPDDMPPEPRILSWKGIARYFGVSIRTVQRWESTEGLPVRRHQHGRQGSVYAIAGELETWLRGKSKTATAEGILQENATDRIGSKSIAVLPFLNLDSEQRTSVVADAITEELTSALSHIPGLKVTARTSAYFFKDRGVDVREVGRRLGVAFVLEGSVRKNGQRLRTTAQLIDARNGFHLWAKRFNHALGDLFEIQDNICAEIVESLQIRFETGLGGVSFQAAREFHELYITGRYFWNQRTGDGIGRAIECFEQTIEQTPAFALAYAGLADCWVFRWVYECIPWETAVEKAERNLAQALKLQPDLGDALASRGLTRIMRYDLAGAEEAFCQALKIHPGLVRAGHWRAMVHALQGRLEEALVGIKEVHALDRLGMTVNQDFGRILYFLNEYEQAVERLEYTLKIAPHAPWARLYLLLAQLMLENHEAVLHAAGGDRFLVAIARAAAGNEKDARRLLQAGFPTDRDQTWKGLLYFSLGDYSNSVQFFTRAAKRHELAYLELCVGVQPLLNPLRANPMFNTLPLMYDGE